MNRTVAAFLLILSILCPGIGSGEIVDRIIAIVNDDIITLMEAEKYVHVEKQGRFVSVNEYFRNIQLREKIDALIDNVLIRQQARKLKIDVSNKEVAGIVENIKKQYLVTDEELREQLKKDNINYRDFVDGLRTSALRNKVIAQVISPEFHVTEAMLKNYYNGHLDDYKEEEYRLKQIFLSNKTANAQKKALEAYGLLREGKSFETVAKEYSEDPSAPEGGDIGLIKSNELIPIIREAVKGLSPGAYTEVIQTPYGFLILKLVELKRGEVIDFETVKDRVHERIVREESDRRYKDFVDKLRKSSYIEVKI